MHSQKPWTIEQTKALYNIERWGEGYFDINADGDLIALPSRDQGQVLVLKEIVAQAKEQGLALPLLVRFPELLQSRIKQLRNAFEQAMQEQNYQGQYYPVYPIKVNHQRRVVKEMLAVTPQIGLESGSKAELVAILGLFAEQSGLIVCNGYKDRETIRLALIGQALGHRVLIILEKQSELAWVLEEADKLGQSPQLGIRVRLNSVGYGKWQNTGGEKSKFGLTAQQCLEVIDQLKEKNKLESLVAIHAHLGSQIANLSDIRKGMMEVARLYQSFHSLGAPIKTIDVGGGLGVDYEGTASQSECSMNYSIDDYARAVVQTLATCAHAHGLPHPNIITESGRAMTAHHAVLVTEIIDYDEPFQLNAVSESAQQIPSLAQWFYKAIKELNVRDAQSLFEQAQNTLKEAQHMYVDGHLELEAKAQTEIAYYQFCLQLKEILAPFAKEHLELWNTINHKIATKYFCNFSLFQSLPDIWAIDQIFPIMPVEGLDTKPNHRGLIKDLTCDSDGRIDHYVDGMGIESTLPLPSVKKGSLLAFFMVGAYQEILGDIHNLFGDTDSVHVKWTSKGCTLVEPLLGDRVETILRAVQFEPNQMLQSYKQQINKSSLTHAMKQTILGYLSASLTSSTYLDRS